MPITRNEVSTGAAAVDKAQITGIYVYPVKSMRGIALERTTLTPRGLLHDRRWMVVRPSGRFVTQREEPRLALVSTRLIDDGVILSADGHGSVTIPFKSAGGEPVAARVWNDDCSTIDEGPEISRWLTGVLNSPEPLRIVRMAPGFTRPQGDPARFGVDTRTLFADSAPYLVANEASLEAVNKELRKQGQLPVPMNRFRPNIVVRGLQAFQEHSVTALTGEPQAGAGKRDSLNVWRIEMADPCVRCLVTTVDQRTAERNPDREPYLTLRRINPLPGPKPAPVFAQNALLGCGEGETLACGDTAVVTTEL